MSTYWVVCSHDAATCPRPRESDLASCEHVGAGEGMPPIAPPEANEEIMS